jgi:hypothetical protein
VVAPQNSEFPETWLESLPANGREAVERPQREGKMINVTKNTTVKSCILSFCYLRRSDTRNY